MNSINPIKIIGSLSLIAILTVILFVTALIGVKPAHAADPISFPNVIIENNTMSPLAIADSNSSDISSVAASISPSRTIENVDLFTNSLEARDMDVSKVDIKDNYVAIGYRQPAKFLGIIPMSVIADVKVEGTGKVSVNYPWYTFLSKKQNDAGLKADLKTRVAAMTSEAVRNNQTDLATLLYTTLKDHSAGDVVSAVQ